MFFLSFFLSLSGSLSLRVSLSQGLSLSGSLSLSLSLSGLNPSFMNYIFQARSSNYASRNPNNLSHYRPSNQVTFGIHSLKFVGPEIWNFLPNELKSVDSLNTFKRLIAKWDGPMCNCNACRFTTNNVQTVQEILICFN